MSFETALALVLLVAVFVMACTMANLLARLTRLERFAQEVLARPAPAPVQLAGMAAPDELAKLTNGRDDAQLVFLSADCPACDEAIELVSGWPEDVRRSTYLVYKGEPADGFTAPAGVRVVPGARGAFASLSIGPTPAFVQVEGGKVTGRSTGLPHGHAEPAEHAPHAEHAPEPDPARR